jgi:hypothetical protein
LSCTVYPSCCNLRLAAHIPTHILHLPLLPDTLPHSPIVIIFLFLPDTPPVAPVSKHRSGLTSPSEDYVTQPVVGRP